MGDEQQAGLARGTPSPFRPEGDALWRQVAGFLVGNGEVAIVGVLHEDRRLRVGDVPDHDAADALQPDKGIGAPVDLAQRQRLGFRPLIVAAAVEAVILATAVEGCQAGIRR